MDVRYGGIGDTGMVKLMHRRLVLVGSFRESGTNINTTVLTIRNKVPS